MSAAAVLPVATRSWNAKGCVFGNDVIGFEVVEDCLVDFELWNTLFPVACNDVRERESAFDL